MRRHYETTHSRSALVLVLITASATPVTAQQANQNINVLPVITQQDEFDDEWFKLGDGFLQRQVEPTIAVSTRNPDHLLAFFNDYRAVDIPDDEGLGEQAADDGPRAHHLRPDDGRPPAGARTAGRPARRRWRPPKPGSAAAAPTTAASRGAGSSCPAHPSTSPPPRPPRRSSGSKRPPTR